MTKPIDVFISYAREDRPTATKLAEALETRGLNVWWDVDIIAGTQFHEAIQTKINEAKRVIVLWSPDSVASDFVLDEAGRAHQQEKLLPISLDGTSPALGFGALHTLFMKSDALDVDAVEAALKGTSPPPRPPDPEPELDPVVVPDPVPSRPWWRSLGMYQFLFWGLIAGAVGWFTLFPPAPEPDPDPKLPIETPVAGGDTPPTGTPTALGEQDNIAKTTEIYTGPPIVQTNDYFNAFSNFLSDNGLRRVSAGGLLTLADSHPENGPCAGKNHVPPKELWPNIIPVAQALEMVKKATGAQVTVISAYRSTDYNDCVGGANRSLHTAFKAIDILSNSLTPEQLAAEFLKLQKSGDLKGGIGIHETFIHLDSRPENATWKN